MLRGSGDPDIYLGDLALTTHDGNTNYYGIVKDAYPKRSMSLLGIVI